MRRFLLLALAVSVVWSFLYWNDRKWEHCDFDMEAIVDYCLEQRGSGVTRQHTGF